MISPHYHDYHPNPTFQKPQGRLEWESDSGRQLTLLDVQISELSKVETDGLQRQAVHALQAMEIPVSYGVLKGDEIIHCWRYKLVLIFMLLFVGARGKVQMRSFNTFNKRKVIGTEKQGKSISLASASCNLPFACLVDNVVSPDRQAMAGESGIFGQPLTSVLSKDPLRPTSGTSTPVTPTSTLPRTVHPPSLSPTTSYVSDTSFLDDSNATAILLEALSSNSTPSPRARRRQSLCPADRQVPSIVTKAIEYLDTKGVKMEGLFRISGAKARINEVIAPYVFVI